LCGSTRAAICGLFVTVRIAYLKRRVAASGQSCRHGDRQKMAARRLILLPTPAIQGGVPGDIDQVRVVTRSGRS
jgi:hypothetical protein